MSARVIQGSFVGGRPCLPNTPALPKIRSSPSGRPAPGFPLRLPVAQPGPFVQARRVGEPLPVDPAQLGLVSAGGRTLPEAVRSKMETALRADFSAVRVHVGPQAQRIGAVAFTIGADIYFAPGRFQPDTIHGQQLLGHELAHVVQQRQGRVRNPAGAGVVVVQDRLLEAEADRLGYLAAAQRTTTSASLPARLPPPRPRGAVQRMEQMSVDKEPSSPEPQEPAMNFFLLPPSVRNQIIGYVKHEEPNLDTPRLVSKEFLAETERVRAISDPSVWELEVDPGEDPGLAPGQQADHYVAQMLLMEERAEISCNHMREMVKSKNKLGELDHGKHEEDNLSAKVRTSMS